MFKMVLLKDYCNLLVSMGYLSLKIGLILFLLYILYNQNLTSKDSCMGDINNIPYLFTQQNNKLYWITIIYIFTCLEQFLDYLQLRMIKCKGFKGYES